MYHSHCVCITFNPLITPPILLLRGFCEPYHIVATFPQVRLRYMCVPSRSIFYWALYFLSISLSSSKNFLSFFIISSATPGTPNAIW